MEIIKLCDSVTGRLDRLAVALCKILHRVKMEVESNWEKADKIDSVLCMKAVKLQSYNSFNVFLFRDFT